jgi:acyl CoA:acetate/3-ketoacid CoA transferase beta subunit
VLREIISHATLDDVRAMTAATFEVSPTLRTLMD